MFLDCICVFMSRQHIFADLSISMQSPQYIISSLTGNKLDISYSVSKVIRLLVGFYDLGIRQIDSLAEFSLK